jgi:hypothetical protein
MVLIQLQASGRLRSRKLQGTEYVQVALAMALYVYALVAMALFSHAAGCCALQAAYAKLAQRVGIGRVPETARHRMFLAESNQAQG